MSMTENEKDLWRRVYAAYVAGRKFEWRNSDAVGAVGCANKAVLEYRKMTNEKVNS